MIDEIKISDIATYKSPIIINPKKINFFYGSNGSGKTTISNILGQYVYSSKSEIVQSNTSDTKILVYNKKFVQENFKNSNEIKGIFTLGEGQINIEEKMNQFNKTLKDKEEKLSKNENNRNKIFKDLDLEKKSLMMNAGIF